VKKLAIAVFATAAALMIAALAAPFFIPADFVKSSLETLVKERTGRDLHIIGPVSVTLFPRASLTANDVTLSNPPGAFRSDFARFKTIDASLKLFPLLQGAIEIDRVIFLEPKVSLEVDKDGRRNWTFHREARPSTTARPAGHARSSGAPSAVRIIDGEVSYLDRRTDQKYVLSFVNMNVSSASSASVDGSMMYNGKRVTMALTIVTPGTFYDGGVSPATLRIISPSANFAFDGEVTIKGSRANGAVDLEVPSLRGLASWLEAPLIMRSNGRGRLLAAGRLEALGKKITLSDAKISLDAAPVSGLLSIEDGDGHESFVTAKLRAQGANVKELLSAVAGVDQIAGHGDLSIDITAHGKSIKDAVASLNGSGSIALADGSLTSEGMAELLNNAFGPRGDDRTGARELEYTSLTGSGTIANGVLHNDDLRLTSPKMTATGAGTVYLSQRRIDYVWLPEVANRGSGQVLITGTWDNPIYKVQSVTINGTMPLPNAPPGSRGNFH
jgi:uncharacterized protein involved in outer membrane biogenesis